jgi:phage gp36-like protein
MPVSYCQPADIRNNVAGTDNGTGTCAQLSDQQIAQAIAQASAKISAYAGTAWIPDADTPAVVIPDLIFSTTVQLATFYATLVYRKNKPLVPGDPALLGYQDAMLTLNAIAAGTIVVAPAPPGEAPVEGGTVIQTIPAIFRYSDSGTEPDGRGGIMPAGAPGSRLIDGWGR